MRSNESSRKQARVILRQREKEIGQSGAKNLTRMIRNCDHMSPTERVICAFTSHTLRTKGVPNLVTAGGRHEFKIAGQGRELTFLEYLVYSN